MPEHPNTEPFPADPGTRVPWLCLHCGTTIGYVDVSGTLAVYSRGVPVALLRANERGMVRCQFPPCMEWRRWRGGVRRKTKRPSLRRGV